MQDPYFNQFPEHQILKCPRCDSSNTKFCYYNNYNLSQPRHYCKNCKRYWTKGGTLRNIPVGGAIRKITKRSSSNTKRAITTPTATHTTNDSPQATTSAPSEVRSNKSEQEQQKEQQQQQQIYAGGSASSSASFLIDNLCPRMSGLDQMGGFGGGEERMRLDAKVESEERFGGLESGEMNCWSGGSSDWPDLAIYTTPGGSGFQ